MLDIDPDAFNYTKYCDKYRKTHGAFNAGLEKAIKTRLLSPKQVEVIHDIVHTNPEDMKKVILFLGATRSGKTYASAFAFCLLMYLSKDLVGDIAICCRDSRSFYRNIFPALIKVAGRGRVITKTLERHGYVTVGGVKCFLLATYSTDFTSKIRGATLKGIYFDELSQASALIYHECQTRLTAAGSWFLATSNASIPGHWMQHEIINPPNHIKNMFQTVHFSLNDNPMMSDEEKLKYAKYISSDELSFRRFILGEWVQMQGLVYNFATELHVLASKPNDKAEGYLVGVDWGSFNPSTAILIAYNRASRHKIWIEDEIYFDLRDSTHRITPADFSFEINKKWGYLKYADLEMYIDPSAPVVADELRRFDFNICKSDNDVLAGIQTVSNILSMGSLFVLKHCENTIREFGSYQWDLCSNSEDKLSAKHEQDKVLKKYDHCMDAIRYALHSRFPCRLGVDPFEEDAEVKRQKTSPHYDHVKFLDNYYRKGNAHQYSTSNPKNRFL